MPEGPYSRISTHIFAKRCKLIGFWIFQTVLLFFLHTLLLCHILLFGCLIFQYHQAVKQFWIKIRPDILSSLIWVQTVCKGCQQIAKVVPSRQRVLNTKELVDTTLQSVKLISFGFNFFHLATTNSEPG